MCARSPALGGLSPAVGCGLVEQARAFGLDGRDLGCVLLVDDACPAIGGRADDRLERRPQALPVADSGRLAGGVASRAGDLGQVRGGPHPHTEEPHLVPRPLAILCLAESLP